MATDPRRLKPAQLIRLLNSTPLGTVIGERQLLRHRNRAGHRIGDDATVDLLRYVAWLVLERHTPKPEPEGLTGYDAVRERAARRNRELALSGRDIGELPAVADRERKQRCRDNFRLFCEVYFPSAFQQEGEFWPWSDDHLRVMALIETVVLRGGQFAVAMPRGSGKTTLCECAVLWAILYGFHSFAGIFGPDEQHARDRIENLKTMLVSEPLASDFPEACYPIQKLEGINQRKLVYHGGPVKMDFKADKIRLPNIPESPCSGSVIYTAGLTGRIRGPNVRREDGRVMRPTLVLIDDPQTRESARSPAQCIDRERIITADVLGLAGPGEEIAALLPCTVIYPGDLADRILDRKANPQWQGQRTCMVPAWPKNEALWLQYAELRKGMHDQCGGDKQRLAEACNAFYAQRRAAMDEGAAVAWPDRKLRNELSAIQHAWNLRIDRTDYVFFAEYQNAPMQESDVPADALRPGDIMARVNNCARGVVPAGCTRLTMFIDVQQAALYWLVAAWEDDFTGAIADYGTEPDQKLPYFTLREVRRTLARAAPRAGLEGAIFAGLERLVARTVGRAWRCDDGSCLRIERCLIDANWGQSTQVIYRFCRQSEQAAVLLPSHGKYVGASSNPVSEWARRPGERIGLNWRFGPSPADRGTRRIVFDTNYWKSFVQARLTTPMGDPGALTLFGRQAVPTGTEPELHRLLADHLTSEYSVRTEGRGRTVDEWKLRLAGSDNHWLDACVGAAVAASLQGAVLPGTEPRRLRRTLSFSEIARRKRARA